MPQDPDAYAIWGDWDLQRFKVLVPRWRDETHPPDYVVEAVKRWWPRLRQPLEWGGAPRVGRELDHEGTLRWMWVPEATWLDDEHACFRVQCWFRVYERDRPPRLVCDEIRTVPSLTPPEGDRPEGMA